MNQRERNPASNLYCYRLIKQAINKNTIQLVMNLFFLLKIPLVLPIPVVLFLIYSQGGLEDNDSLFCHLSSLNIFPLF